MSDKVTLDDLASLECKECGRVGLCNTAFYPRGKGNVQYALACPSCDWEQKTTFDSLRAAVAAYTAPPAPRPATDYLKLARQSASGNYYGDASAYAAIAQAEAMQRIAECLETIVDDMAQTRRTLRDWQGEL